MHHTKIEYFKELGKLEGGKTPWLISCILEIATAEDEDHLRVGRVFEKIRNHVGKTHKSPTLEQAATYANQVAIESGLSHKTRSMFKIRIGKYLKGLSGGGDDGGDPGGAPASPVLERKPQRNWRGEPR